MWEQEALLFRRGIKRMLPGIAAILLDLPEAAALPDVRNPPK